MVQSFVMSAVRAALEHKEACTLWKNRVIVISIAEHGRLRSSWLARYTGTFCILLTVVASNAVCHHYAVQQEISASSRF